MLPRRGPGAANRNRHTRESIRPVARVGDLGGVGRDLSRTSHGRINVGNRDAFGVCNNQVRFEMDETSILKRGN